MYDIHTLYVYIITSHILSHKNELAYRIIEEKIEIKRNKWSPMLNCQNYIEYVSVVFC
jgi:hypothetical protein